MLLLYIGAPSEIERAQLASRGPGWKYDRSNLARPERLNARSSRPADLVGSTIEVLIWRAPRD